MNRRSIGFVVFILLAVIVSIAFGAPNLPHFWYDGEIVRGKEINFSLGNKLDNAQPVLATYTTVAAGATIAVPSTYGYVRITDDNAAAANEVTVAVGTDGQMLFVFNGDAQATVGAVTIPTLTGKWGIYASGTWTFSEQSGLSESVSAHIASTGADVHGLGTISTVNSPVPIANGGTGQTASSAALTALGGFSLNGVNNYIYQNYETAVASVDVTLADSIVSDGIYFIIVNAGANDTYPFDSLLAIYTYSKSNNGHKERKLTQIVNEDQTNSVLLSIEAPDIINCTTSGGYTCKLTIGYMKLSSCGAIN